MHDDLTAAYRFFKAPWLQEICCDEIESLARAGQAGEEFVLALVAGSACTTHVSHHLLLPLLRPLAGLRNSPAGLQPFSPFFLEPGFQK